jgi:hypothetical protein
VEEENMGVKYDSPHMWIVALIGSDRYSMPESYRKELIDKELRKGDIFSQDDNARNKKRER